MRIRDFPDIFDRLKTIISEDGARVEVVHPLIKDEALRNLLTLWGMISISFHKPDGEIPQDDNEALEWIWSGVVYDKENLASSMRLKELDVQSLLRRGRTFRLIYPDGTVNKSALAYVRQEVKKSILKGSKKSTTTPNS